MKLVKLIMIKKKLLKVTKDALYKGIEMAVSGNHIGDISYAVQKYAESFGYGVVRELVIGHGIGKNLHEAPEVPNYGSNGKGILLKEGLVIAIEPMINMEEEEFCNIMMDGQQLLIINHLHTLSIQLLFEKKMQKYYQALKK